MSRIADMLRASGIADVLEAALDGVPPDADGRRRLAESDEVHLMGMVAGLLASRRFGRRATYVNNIILNYTNVCITDCKFCAFYRPPGADGAYTLTLDEIDARVRTAREMFRITQVLIQGGHNPDLGIEYYEDAFRTIRSRYPEVGVHGLSASEIDMIARVEGTSTREVVSRLKDAGLQSVPGAGAEMKLVDRVKSEISPLKITTAEWLRIMGEAHDAGLPASATMMYGPSRRLPTWPSTSGSSPPCRRGRLRVHGVHTVELRGEQHADAARQPGRLVRQATEEDKQIIFTTHSDHLLFPLLAYVAKDGCPLDCSDVAMHYFNTDESGRIAGAERLAINKHGQIRGGLKGFSYADGLAMSEIMG